jgi:hypothetical protein
MTDTTSGALPGLRAGSSTVRPAGPGTGFSTRNPLGTSLIVRTWHHRPGRGSACPDKDTP